MTPEHLRRHGMLMVLMAPPSALEEEFHDWYDLEHVPQRQVLPGFHTAIRWFCTKGWPPYMACYDLESVGVLEEDTYKAIGGPNSSPWSKRILSRVVGYQRFLLEQAMPGRGRTADEANGLVLIRFAGHLSASLGKSLPSLGLDTSCQARVFETRGTSEAETLIVVDAPALELIPTWAPSDLRGVLGQEANRLIGEWRYIRYRRSNS